jgi:hypothetical protein
MPQLVEEKKMADDKRAERSSARPRAAARRGPRFQVSIGPRRRGWRAEKLSRPSTQVLESFFTKKEL